MALQGFCTADAIFWFPFLSTVFSCFFPAPVTDLCPVRRWAVPANYAQFFHSPHSGHRYAGSDGEFHGREQFVQAKLLRGLPAPFLRRPPALIDQFGKELRLVGQVTEKVANGSLGDTGAIRFRKPGA